MSTNRELVCVCVRACERVCVHDDQRITCVVCGVGVRIHACVRVCMRV